MKLKSAYKYQMSEFISPVRTFYIVMILLESFIIFLASKGNNESNVSGVEFSSYIFLFVMAIVIYKSTFHFLSANSISRKTLLKSTFLTIASISGIMFVIDTINVLILKQITVFSRTYQGLFEIAFNKNFHSINFLQYFLFNYVNYFCFFTLGFFIVTTMYRLSLKAKAIVLISMGVTINIVFPYIYRLLYNNNITFLQKISSFINKNILQKANGSIIAELSIILVFGLIACRVASRASVNAK